MHFNSSFLLGIIVLILCGGYNKKLSSADNMYLKTDVAFTISFLYIKILIGLIENPVKLHDLY